MEDNIKQLEAQAVIELSNLPNDEEAAHGLAEQILCNFLRKAGYQQIADAFELARDEVGFWYA
jgi:hypothetical protein